MPELIEPKAGRNPNGFDIGTIDYRYRGLAEREDLRGYEFAIGMAISIAHRHKPLKELIDKWNALTSEDRRKYRALDDLCIAEGVDPIQFMGWVDQAVKEQRRGAASLKVAGALPEMVEQDLSEAMRDGGHAIRKPYLQKEGILDPPPGQTPVNFHVTANANSQSATVQRSEPQSFDDFLAHMDRVTGAEQRALPAAQETITVEPIKENVYEHQESGQ